MPPSGNHTFHLPWAFLVLVVSPPVPGMRPTGSPPPPGQNLRARLSCAVGGPLVNIMPKQEGKSPFPASARNPNRMIPRKRKAFEQILLFAPDNLPFPEFSPWPGGTIGKVFARGPVGVGPGAPGNLPFGYWGKRGDNRICFFPRCAPPRGRSRPPLKKKQFVAGFFFSPPSPPGPPTGVPLRRRGTKKAPPPQIFPPRRPAPPRGSAPFLREGGNQGHPPHAVPSRAPRTRHI